MASKRAITYREFREFVKDAKADAERKGAEIMYAGCEVSWRAWSESNITASLSFLFSPQQVALLEAEYQAAYCVSRLHHVRQRQRMDRFAGRSDLIETWNREIDRQ